MVLLHVVAPAEFGGLERVVHGLGCGLHDAGHDVHVAAVLAGPQADDAFLAPLSEAGGPTHPVSLPPPGDPRGRAAPWAFPCIAPPSVGSVGSATRKGRTCCSRPCRSFPTCRSSSP